MREERGQLVRRAGACSMGRGRARPWALLYAAPKVGASAIGAYHTTFSRTCCISYYKSLRPGHHEGNSGPCRLSTALAAIRAAAARYHFQMLDFLAHGFVEDGVGQEDQPVRASVGVVVLTGFSWTEYARLIGVHSL
jgi:hypothetical protein